MPAEMKHIMDIADSHDLQVIEDACQAHGAEVDGKKVGALGHVATFSFYATKNMMTGEGGMITTDNEELYDEILMVKNHGRGKQGGYSHFRIGYNNRMMDLVSAIGIEQIKRLPEAVKKRRSIAQEYDDFFVEFESIKPQVEVEGLKSSYHLYVPRLYSDKMNRDEIVSALRNEGVGSRAVYALPCHKQDTYLNIQQWRWSKFVDYPDYSALTLPASEEIGLRHFDIPVHPLLTNEDKEHIKQAFNKILG
jgi:perosamine synthetase